MHVEDSDVITSRLTSNRGIRHPTFETRAKGGPILGAERVLPSSRSRQGSHLSNRPWEEPIRVLSAHPFIFERLYIAPPYSLWYVYALSWAKGLIFRWI
jgi:hypothetical protein